MSSDLIVSVIAGASCLVSLPYTLVNHILNSKQLGNSSIVAVEIEWFDTDRSQMIKQYVTWSGQSSSTPNSIEISQYMANIFNLMNGQKVTVRPIKEHIPSGVSVQVEPLTEDDWEIVELHAQYLEEQMLNQVRILYDGLIFPLTIGQIIIRLKVVGVSPSNSKCVILGPDSEIIIAPKPRKRTAFNGTVTSPSVNKVKSKSKVTILRIQPLLGISIPLQCVLLHPHTLLKLHWNEGQIVQIDTIQKPTTSSSSPEDEDSNENSKENSQDKSQLKKKTSIFLKIVSSGTVSVNHIGISDICRVELDVNYLERVKVKVKEGLPILHVEHIKVQKLLLSSVNKSNLVESNAIISHIKELCTVNTKLNNSHVPIATNLLIKFTTKHCFLHGHIDTDVFYCNSCIHHQFYFNLNFSSSSKDSSSLITTPFILDLNDLLYSVINIESNVMTFNLNSSIPLYEEEQEEVEDTKDKSVSNLLEYLTLMYHNSSSILKSTLVSSNTGIIVYGSHGTGKSFLVTKLLQKLHYNRHFLIYSSVVECSKLTEKRVDKVKDLLQEKFKEAITNAPSILFLDDLDLLIPDSQEQENVRSSQLCEILIDLFNLSVKYSNNQISVIATCQTVTSVHSTVKNSYLFGKTVELTSPDHLARCSILKTILSKKFKKSVSSIDTQLVDKVSSLCEGYLSADLHQFVERTIDKCSIRILNSVGSSVDHNFMSNNITYEDFVSAQEGFLPISLKGIQLHSSETQWKDIGGLQDVKRTLKETLEWPTKYPKLFENIPLRPRSGLLLFGPPGCGKSILASAVAKECGLNFISIKGPELLNKYIGASEQSVRDLFRRAEQAKPCILFFDEFESIAPRRGHDNTGVTDRVVNQLLTQLDGVEGLQGVYVLAATSRPDLIDPALLRPGRLDKALYCSIPTKEDRIEILKAVSYKLKLSPDISFEEIAENTPYFTGADLQAMLYNSQLEAIHQSLPALSLATISNATEDQTDHVTLFKVNSNIVPKSQQISEVLERLPVIRENSQSEVKENSGEKSKAETSSVPVIHTSHILKALTTSRPSVSTKERINYERIYEDFLGSRGDFKVADTSGPRQTLA